MSGRKKRFMRFLQSGILLIAAGSLFFLYHIPWTWMKINCPLLVYGNENRGVSEDLVCKSIIGHIPLYAYAGCEERIGIAVQNQITEKILLAEGRDEENEQMPEEMERVYEENAGKKTQEQEQQIREQQVQTAETEVEESRSDFDVEVYRDIDRLLTDFYVVDKSTYINAEELDADKMLNLDLSLDKNVEGPQILIYHTHSQEAYADSVEGDKTTTVVGAGEQLAQILQEEYGFAVLHHEGEYDVENRDYAYANVVPDLERILLENPSIEVVIDLHRDGVAGDTRLVTEIDGKKTAQFMFFNGLSRLSSVGEIDYLKNENRSTNLAFSFQLQVKCREYYPGLARNIYLKGYRYNMQYRGRSLLVELGAQTNTVEEVYNAVPHLAHVLAMVLGGDDKGEALEEAKAEER